MKVAVLGCGPAGLLAAHAANQLGYEIIIYSDKRRSPVPGAQYLHSPIPGATLEDPDFTISVAKIGTGEGYSYKVYGVPDYKSSWEGYKSGDYPAWDLRTMYDYLWEIYEECIVDANAISSEFIETLIASGFHVISTIPKTNICYYRDGGHEFNYVNSYIGSLMGELYAGLCERNMIVYNGDPDYEWSRCSRIGSDPMIWFEYPSYHRGTNIVKKPQNTNCDCFKDEGVLFVGRAGAWERDILVDDVYRTVRERLK